MRNFINIIENANAAMTSDEVDDVLLDFLDEIEYGDVIYDVDIADGKYPQIVISGDKDRLTGDFINHMVAPLRSRIHGWSLAKRHYSDNDGDFFLFLGWLPDQGKGVIVPHTVYHISPTNAHDAIVSGGIKASHGGNDFIRTDNARTYVVLSLLDVDGIADDLARHRGAGSYDIWEIDTSFTQEWYDDVELSDSAAWTPNDIPVSHIRWKERGNYHG